MEKKLGKGFYSRFQGRSAFRFLFFHVGNLKTDVRQTANNENAQEYPQHYATRAFIRWISIRVTVCYTDSVKV